MNALAPLEDLRPVGLDELNDAAGLQTRVDRKHILPIHETKSGCRAGALDRALRRRGHRPATVSKYGTGLAALRPALPRNKWHRTLVRHFPRVKGTP